MAKKKSSNTTPLSSGPSSPSSTSSTLPPVFPPLEGRPLPTVHVNNANLVELKHACDDAVKKIMQTHQFTELHVHTDIRLFLGWLSVFIALGSSGWAYKVGFEESKLLVAVAVVCYTLVTGLQMGYAYYVEGRTIYQGKRKSLSKRIETELLRISTTTVPSTSTAPPHYSLTLAYRRSSNNNKSLIRKSSHTISVPYGELVDAAGGLEEGRVADWVGWGVGKVVGDEKEVGSPVE